MNKEQVNFWLAVALLAASGLVLVLARVVSRSKASRRISEYAGELGLSELDPEPPEIRSFLRSDAIRGEWGNRSIVSTIGGVFEGREVVLAEVEERPGKAGTDRETFGRSLARRLDSVLGGRLSKRFAGGSRAVNHLMIVFVEPVPGLPEFRIGSRSKAGLDRWIDQSPDPIGSPVGPPGHGLVLEPDDAREALPGPFLDRACRVLIGRPRPWAVEGVDGLMALRISDWQPSSNARTYRAILDAARSLRELLDEHGPSPGAPAAAPPVRSALERIRQASGQSTEEPEAGGPAP